MGFSLPMDNFKNMKNQNRSKTITNIFTWLIGLRRTIYQESKENF
jgi:hypothetical protein